MSLVRARFIWSQASAVVLAFSTAAPAEDLVIAQGGKTQAVVVVSPQAGTWEKRGAEDLVHYIEAMTGARPALANTDAARTAALNANGPILIVGTAALQADPTLAAALAKVRTKP